MRAEEAEQRVVDLESMLEQVGLALDQEEDERKLDELRLRVNRAEERSANIERKKETLSR